MSIFVLIEYRSRNSNYYPSYSWLFEAWKERDAWREKREGLTNRYS